MDIGSGRILKEYKGHIHNSFKSESCFDSNNTNILSLSEDGKVFHWDLLSGRLEYQSVIHRKAGSSISFHPSKSIFVTASYDGDVKLWDSNQAYLNNNS